MAKKIEKDDPALDNLAGFFVRGANFKSKGNVPTGHFDLDFAIHHGYLPAKADLSKLEDYDPAKTLGVPLGKLMELFGEEGSGKSSLAYRIVGYAQKMGYDCCWIDTEHSFSENLAKINGCDQKELIYSNMSNNEKEDKVYYAEDIFDYVFRACKVNSDIKKKGGKSIGVIVVDSVANMVSKARHEADADQYTIGIIARLMSENLGKISNYASKYGVLVVFINQIRDKMGAKPWEDPDRTPGGKSLGFNASLRLKLTKKFSKDADMYMTDEDGDSILIGRRVNCKLVKNRFAKPLQGQVEIPIYYESYFPDIEDTLFNIGRQLQVIRKYKGKFRWGNLDDEANSIEVDKSAIFIEHLQYKKLTNALMSSIAAKAEEKKVILPPELTKAISEMHKKEKTDGMERDVSGSGKKKASKSSDKVAKK